MPGGVTETAQVIDDKGNFHYSRDYYILRITPAARFSLGKNSHIDVSSLVEDAVRFLEPALSVRPRVALILGSGLGPLADRAEPLTRIPYEKIPGFPPSTVHGHAGELLVGKLGEYPALFLRGRVHFYEGVPLSLATLPVRVVRKLGVETLIVTNASGGIADHLEPGNVVAVRDHLNLMGANPLIGYQPAEGEERFVDLTHAYPVDLRDLAVEEARHVGIELQSGVYAAMSGPSYETPAEIQMLRAMGADLIGMSTVPEVIVANQVGLRVLVLSCVSNKAAGSTGEPLSHNEVIETANRVAGPFSDLIERLVARLS